MNEVCPRITIAGTAGDSGKTLLSLGLIGVLRRRAKHVAAFKKGPDFIDAAWLGRAANGDGYNLDTFLMDERAVVTSFVRRSRTADIAVIEGNRGLHDGRDAQGTHSTAALAALLGSPIILIHQVTKATRTAAAAIIGCCRFEDNVNVAGVVLNGVAGERHRRVITESLQQAGGPPVVGAIPRLPDRTSLPGRHLGLVTPAEHTDAALAIEQAADIVDEFVDVTRLVEIACTARPLEHRSVDITLDEPPMPRVRIGVMRDSAFTFYYPENLEALLHAGGELVDISSLNDQQLPEDLDGLYIGGGFPETHARAIANNVPLRRDVKRAADAGMPIYAECGGLVYLAKSLEVEDVTYPMAGVFPIRVACHRKPRGHGYSQVRMEKNTPFFAAEQVIHGHEFHYTQVTGVDGELTTAGAVQVGTGCLPGRDGLIVNQTMAWYVHHHALGTPTWAPAFVRAAAAYQVLRDTASRTDSAAG